MIYFEHRKNLISELSSVDISNGVEIDLRSDVNTPGKIHLAHDPWVKGDDFEEWIRRWTELGIQGTIILNTKEDSLETRAVELLKKYSLDNFIFLDTTVPTFVKHHRGDLAQRFFVRLSKYENLESALQFKNVVQWLWVDCFHLEMLSTQVIDEAKKHFKLCLVSPELQGGSEDDLKRFTSYAKKFDAICTKKFKVWQGLLNE